MFGLDGLIYVADRLGENGKPIKVYKIRTMCEGADFHLSEVLSNGVDNLGKPKEDGRVTWWGKYLRRYHIDELPQLYNLLFERNMELVGIRPRNDLFWSFYSEEHKKRALKYAPGICGVVYSKRKVDDVKDIESIESEYLDRREKSPSSTNLRYLLMIFFNKTFFGVRSR